MFPQHVALNLLLALGLLVIVPICKADCVDKFTLVEMDGSQNFQGLTSEGLEFLKSQRDTLRQRFVQFTKKYKSLETIFHGGTVTRLFKGNMFLYGPPGGAKSGFVNWMMSHEDGKMFRLQMNQLITEQAFTGGQNFEAAKKGLLEFLSLIHI